MSIPYNKILSEATREYFENMDKDNPPTADVIEEELLLEINVCLHGDNAIRDKSEKLPILKCLPAPVIAECLYNLNYIRKINCTGRQNMSDSSILAIYVPDGPRGGTYSTDERIFYKKAKEFCYTITKQIFKEVLEHLMLAAEEVCPCQDADLIFVGNGIFNYKTKQLMPFSPEYVSLSKCGVDYIPLAANPSIYNPIDKTTWDIENWMNELSDDPEIVNLLWETIGAVIRPNVSWNKSVWFYSNSGNNGKGTLCHLMRNLCGEGNYASLSISDMSKEFMLEPLLTATAVITDENDVGAYCDRAANLKAIITNDVILINRKHRAAISFQFHGFMVQCVNDLPKMRDRSESIYRRLMFVPFNKCFTGQERKYIKDDYLNRKEVLEYVLHRVLHMNYYSLSQPAACSRKLDEYKIFNDPVRAFAEDILPRCQWDLLPFTFLYDVYKAWYKNTNPSGIIISNQVFIQDLEKVVPAEWIYDKHKQYRIKNMLSKPEYLIEEYDLEHWYGMRNSQDPQKRLVPRCTSTLYRGLLRATAAGHNTNSGGDSADSSSDDDTLNNNIS